MMSAFLGAMLVPGLALAQGEEHAMPEMGPPKQMKELTVMNGVYDVEMKYKMDPTAADWTTTNGLATVKMVLDGAAQQMDWQGEMMGQKFTGMGLTTYDREAKAWQNTWVDSMSGRITMASGEMADGKMVFSGANMMQGMKIHTKQTSYNITEKGFDWKYEMSMDGGETYMTAMTATYTKR
jgi:hypothetical protein